MSRLRLSLTVAMVALSAACSSTPEYKKPEMTMPASWQLEAPFTMAAPADAKLKGEWWQLFSDVTLNNLVQQALAQNPGLVVASSRLQQAQGQANVAAAGLLPQVGVQTGATRLKTSADRPLAAYNSPNQSTVQNNFQLGFVVNYEADVFGRVRNSVASARANAEQAQADFENLRLMLLAELTADYFNLRELDAEIQVVREANQLQLRALQFIRDRHDLGAASGLDMAQQEALAESSLTQLELLQKQRNQFEHALATLSGNPAPDFHLSPQTPMHAPPDTLNLPLGLPSDMLQRRPDIASAERAMAAANANIGVAKAAYYPSILLQPNGGWDSNQLSTLFNAPSILWALGTSLTQTLFDAGKTKANVQIAQAAYRGAAASYRQTVLTALQEVQDGVQGWGSLQRAAQQAQASVNSSQRAFDLANERYSGGVATYLDVLTAQQALLGNQRLWVQIQGQQMLAAVYLIKALGGGWQQR